MNATPDLYDRARAAIERSGFDADAQTKIALFVGTARTLNASMLAAGELQPRVNTAYPFIHGQYCRELEFASLLARVTRWSANPFLYSESAALVAPLWSEWWRIQLSPAAFDPGTAYAAVALGHALLARVRLAPVIGTGVDEVDPFVVALRRIEQESGRMIQTQIRLLKDGDCPLDVRDRERIIDAEQRIVDAAFARFLAWLAGDRDEARPSSWPPVSEASSPLTRSAKHRAGPEAATARTIVMPVPDTLQ